MGTAKNIRVRKCLVMSGWFHINEACPADKVKCESRVYPEGWFREQLLRGWFDQQGIKILNEGIFSKKDINGETSS